MPPCNATYKMAIKFVNWRQDGNHFYHPFQRFPDVSLMVGTLPKFRFFDLLETRISVTNPLLCSPHILFGRNPVRSKEISEGGFNSPPWSEMVNRIIHDFCLNLPNSVTPHRSKKRGGRIVPRPIPFLTSNIMENGGFTISP